MPEEQRTSLEREVPKSIIAEKRIRQFQTTICDLFLRNGKSQLADALLLEFNLCSFTEEQKEALEQFKQEDLAWFQRVVLALREVSNDLENPLVYGEKGENASLVEQCRSRFQAKIINTLREQGQDTLADALSLELNYLHNVSQDSSLDEFREKNRQVLDEIIQDINEVSEALEYAIVPALKFVGALGKQYQEEIDALAIDVLKLYGLQPEISEAIALESPSQTTSVAPTQERKITERQVESDGKVSFDEANELYYLLDENPFFFSQKELTDFRELISSRKKVAIDHVLEQIQGVIALRLLMFDPDKISSDKHKLKHFSEDQIDFFNYLKTLSAEETKELNNSLYQSFVSIKEYRQNRKGPLSEILLSSSRSFDKITESIKQHKQQVIKSASMWRKLRERLSSGSKKQSTGKGVDRNKETIDSDLEGLGSPLKRKQVKARGDSTSSIPTGSKKVVGRVKAKRH